MPKLKVVVDNLDDVEEKHKDLYVEREQDGKFYLNLDNPDAHFRVAGMKASFERLKAERQDFLGKLKAEDYAAVIALLGPDFDKEAFEAMKAELEELRTKVAEGTGGDNKDLAAVKTELATAKRDLGRVTKELATANTSLEASEKRNKEATVDQQLTKSLIDVGIATKHMKAVKAMFKGDIKSVLENGEYKLTINDEPIGDHIKDWAETDDGKLYIDTATGSGARPGGDKGANPADNPFHKDHFNVTAQQDLFAKNPARAEQLVQLAGIKKPDWMKVPAQT